MLDKKLADEEKSGDNGGVEGEMRRGDEEERCRAEREDGCIQG